MDNDQLVFLAERIWNAVKDFSENDFKICGPNLGAQTIYYYLVPAFKQIAQDSREKALEEAIQALCFQEGMPILETLRSLKTKQQREAKDE